MAEKAIVRFDFTCPARACDGERTLRDTGEWMRYDADLVLDAMRYRWLRDKAPLRRSGPCIYEADGLISGTEADTAIDAAISHSGRVQR